MSALKARWHREQALVLRAQARALLRQAEEQDAKAAAEAAS